MSTLDRRLMAVAALLRPGNRMADIGTDHAYLPVYLVQSGRCPGAIAADLRQGPLEAAHRTVTAAGLSDRIELRLGDGLAVLQADEVEDIAVAGMGGETIAAILAAAPFQWRAGLRLVLQPMTRAEVLREWLLTHGFVIQEEHLIVDGHHRYPVLAAAYTGAAPVTDPLAYYAGAFEPAEGRPYRKQMAAHLQRKAAGLSRAGEPEAAARLSAIAARLEQLNK